jgi:diguanylate cyclase (GGDEF)-like protein
VSPLQSISRQSPLRAWSPPRRHNQRTAMTLGALAVASTTAAALMARRQRTLHENLKKLQHEATHDLLTGLPSRWLALRRLTQPPPNSGTAQAITRRPRQAEPKAGNGAVGEVGMVGLLDLDGFKDINDRHGHATGDRYLTAVAQRLVAALSDDGTVYRLSGDEFLIIWATSGLDPLPTAGRILHALARPFTIDGHIFRAAASLGLAIPGPDLSGADLIGAADHVG